MLVTRGTAWAYLTDGQADIVTALVARPAVSQTEMDKIMWPGFSTRPLTYRETRKSRLRLLNLKLAPMGLAVVSDAPSRGSRIACYRLNVEE